MPEIARGGSHKVPMSSVFRAQKWRGGERHPKTAARSERERLRKRKKSNSRDLVNLIGVEGWRF